MEDEVDLLGLVDLGSGDLMIGHVFDDAAKSVVRGSDPAGFNQSGEFLGAEKFGRLLPCHPTPTATPARQPVRF